MWLVLQSGNLAIDRERGLVVGSSIPTALPVDLAQGPGRFPMSTAERPRLRRPLRARQPKPPAYRAADWARVLIFVVVGGAVGVRLASGRSLGRWDVVALIVAATILPGARLVGLRIVKEIVSVFRSR